MNVAICIHRDITLKSNTGNHHVVTDKRQRCAEDKRDEQVDVESIPWAMQLPVNIYNKKVSVIIPPKKATT